MCVMNGHLSCCLLLVEIHLHWSELSCCDLSRMCDEFTLDLL